MAFETPDDYRVQVELNQAILDEELKAIAELSQGAAATAWEEIVTLPPDQQHEAIRRSLDVITSEHGRSAMVAARDNMEAHVTMWAKERRSYAGLPSRIQYTRPLGDDRLDKYADEVYKRLQENGEKDASDAFSRLIANTIINRARNVVVNTCRKAHTRFYRIPERRACWFCLMLASRGAVYYSAYTAGRGHRYHAHCRCTVRAALPGEELHPVVKHLSENYGSGNTSQWRVRAENGELSKALNPHGYQVIKGRYRVTKTDIGIYKLDTPQKQELFRRQNELWSYIPKGELLKESEISFLERIEVIGERVRWHSSDVRNENGQKLPSYDFSWTTRNGMPYELKSPQLQHPDGSDKSIASILQSAARLVTSKKNEAFRNHRFEKVRFVVDLGIHSYDSDTDRWLRYINKRPGEPKIQELLVFANGELHSVELK